MKNTVLFIVLPVLFLLRIPLVSFAQDGDQKPNLVVDDDKVQCPAAGFTTIQSAVNAARPGDVIRVCPGTYNEQVVISKSVHIHGDDGAVVIPTGMTPNAISIPSGNSVAAAILVQNTERVTLEGLIIDGSHNNVTTCSADLSGILYQNASGAIRHNAIRHFRLSAALSGCQSGEGIVIQAGGEASTVTVNANSVWDYQKNGITGDESGTQVNIDRNAVTGIGATSGAAQNGIQVGFGARGAVTNNSITDNVYAPCVTAAQCPANATGILIFQSDGVEVESNSVGTNQIGVAVAADSVKVDANTIFNSVALDGVFLMGNDNQVRTNQILHSDEAGVFVQGNGNRIVGNEITDTVVGIFKVSGSTGNTLANNLIHATLIPVIDPAPIRTINLAPMR